MTNFSCFCCGIETSKKTYADCGQQYACWLPSTVKTYECCDHISNKNVSYLMQDQLIINRPSNSLNIEI